MFGPDHASWRAVRALVVGGSVSVIALAAHVVGGGHHLAWVALLPATAVTTAVAWMMAVRTLQFSQLAALLVAAQLVIHVLGSWLTFMPVLHGGSMVVAHALAAVASAFLIARGDRLWWMLHSWVTRTLPIVVATVVTPRVPVLDSRRAVAAPAWFLGSSMTRRGPPVPAV